MPNNIIMADASGYKASDWLDATKPEGEVIFYGADPVKNGFYGRTNITSLIMPNATWISDGMMFRCSFLRKLVADEATSAGASACEYSGLTAIALPKIRFMYTYSFCNCPNLRAADFGGTPAANEGFFRNNIFSGDPLFDTLVLRANTVWTMANIGMFSNTPFASGKSGGTLYVPQAMISAYQTANNWSTILGYPNNSIAAIEGSQYENYYVDGRPIPTGG